MLSFSSSAQYYLRGEVKDEQNMPIQNAKIFLHSARMLYITGVQGSFGITVKEIYDSLTCSMDGYEPKTLKVKTDIWQSIILKVSATHTTKNKQKLISVTKNMKQTSKYNWFVNDETYFQLVENQFVLSSLYPNTGFSLNVNKASYSNVRRFLNSNSAVPPDAVRVEEMVNYFNLHYTEPAQNETFHISSQLSTNPWNNKEQLLYINISAKKLNLNNIPPGNFVFLIDVSGSMDMPNRLPLLKAAFQSFVKNLRAIDTMSIVMYGGTVGVWLQPTSGAEKEKISKSIEELSASGDTPGESAIRAAYKLAESTFIKGGNNRVILATDGDFNVGETSEKAMDELITKMRQTGVYLTCLGVGMGNFKDSKLQTLAKKGNGNYAYLDDIHEAEKVLVQELTQTFYTVANDALMNIEFNPAMVKEYRLVGFDNKREAIADQSNDLEGGEIGSGNSTLAIFEIVPTPQNQSNYMPGTNESIAQLQLKYNSYNANDSLKKEYIIPNNFIPYKNIHKDLQFATVVTMLALKLKQSPYLDGVKWINISSLAQQSADKNDYLQNEFLMLLAKAQKIYPERKRKRAKIHN
ncbi:MAG: von Willebrand factor type A domain-containing protein [Ferruginibacter sp.]